MFINNNSRFCRLCIRKIFLEECKYAKENIKTKNYIDKELKSEFDSDSDSGTNTEEQIQKKVNQIIITKKIF